MPGTAGCQHPPVVSDFPLGVVVWEAPTSARTLSGPVKWYCCLFSGQWPWGDQTCTSERFLFTSVAFCSQCSQWPLDLKWSMCQSFKMYLIIVLCFFLIIMFSHLKICFPVFLLIMCFKSLINMHFGSENPSYDACFWYQSIAIRCQSSHVVCSTYKIFRPEITILFGVQRNHNVRLSGIAKWKS